MVNVKIAPAPYVKPSKKQCLHPWWQTYQSRKIRICGECGEERKISDYLEENK